MADLNRRLTRVETELAGHAPTPPDFSGVDSPQRLEEIAQTLDPRNYAAGRDGTMPEGNMPGDLTMRILNGVPGSPEWHDASERLLRLAHGDLTDLDAPHWDPSGVINQARLQWIGLGKFFRWDAARHPGTAPAP